MSDAGSGDTPKKYTDDELDRIAERLRDRVGGQILNTQRWDFGQAE